MQIPISVGDRGIKHSRWVKSANHRANPYAGEKPTRRNTPLTPDLVKLLLAKHSRLGKYE